MPNPSYIKAADTREAVLGVQVLTLGRGVEEDLSPVGGRLLQSPPQQCAANTSALVFGVNGENEQI